MPSIPILTNESFRILGIKKSFPDMTTPEIAAKANISVREVYAHLEALRQAKLLKDTDRALQVVK